MVQRINISSMMKLFGPSTHPSRPLCVSTQNCKMEWWMKKVTMPSLWKPDTSIFHPVYQRLGRSRAGTGWVKTWQIFQIQLNFAFWGRLKYHILLFSTLSLQIRVMLCHLIVWKVVLTHVRSGQLYLVEVNIGGSWAKYWLLGAKYWLGPAGRVGWWRVLPGHNDSIGGESQKSRSSSIYYIAPDSLAGWWLLAVVHIL